MNISDDLLREIVAFVPGVENTRRLERLLERLIEEHNGVPDGVFEALLDLLKEPRVFQDVSFYHLLDMINASLPLQLQNQQKKALAAVIVDSYKDYKDLHNCRAAVETIVDFLEHREALAAFTRLLGNAGGQSRSTLPYGLYWLHLHARNRRADIKSTLERWRSGDADQRFHDVCCYYLNEIDQPNEPRTMRYFGGRTIELGDKVLFGGHPGHVVFLRGAGARPMSLPGFELSSLEGIGVLVETDDKEVFWLIDTETDEDLELDER